MLAPTTGLVVAGLNQRDVGLQGLVAGQALVGTHSHLLDELLVGHETAVGLRGTHRVTVLV